jgi:hypothetical protein
MKRLLTMTLLGSSVLLLAGGVANAQYQPRYGDRDYDRDDGYRNRGGDVFDQVRYDLERVATNAYWNSGDRHRIDKVREELGEFQRSGNRHELNDAIGALQKVVNDNRISFREREMLAGDLDRMRDFRARMGWH